MEEVWKDISLRSLQNTRASEEASKSSAGCFRGMILEDFLKKPTKETPPNTSMDPPDIANGLFASTPPIPPPPTHLSLNSSSQFQYLDGMAPHQRHCNAINGVSPNSIPFDSFRSVSEEKKVTESENSSRDRRYKRMIKNRESAARSRARKQAYTNELEHEVAHLMEENAKLRKLQNQLCVAASSAQLPPKHTLYRTSTAPF